MRCKKELVKIATRFYPLSLSQAAYFAQSDKMKEIVGKGFSDTITRYDGTKMEMFRLKEELEDIGKDIIRFVQGRDFLEGVKLFSKRVEDFVNEIENLGPGQVIERFIELYPMAAIASFASGRFQNSIPKNKREKIIETCLEYRTATDKLVSAAESYVRNLTSSKNLPEYFTRIETLVNGKEHEKWLEKSYVSHHGIVENISWKDFLEKGGYIFKKEENEEINELRGKMAFPGKAKGRVRIVFSIREFSKIEEGDILVCPMTTPAYSGFLKKVSAIVTDEGGITCHAAISSRELKIPCIVGVKGATKVLNEGDIVEVDTENEVVRRIEDGK